MRKRENKFSSSLEGQNRAFTLVELIVVITILAILWTIAFVTIQWYSGQSRDAVRISDIWNIKKMLEISLTNGWKLLKPENAIEITASGTLIWYQWEMWKDILNRIWVNNGWKDPKDDKYYTYSINNNQTKYQILWFLEDGESITMRILGEKANAQDYSKRYIYTKWDELWVLLDGTKNEPVNIWWIDIDVANSSVIYNAYFWNNEKITWTWNTLQNLQFSYRNWNWFNPPKTCPTWFIAVPWNKDFNQPWFCISKYEMSYSDWDTPTSTVWWFDWNTVAYVWWKVPTSMAWKYPIADINQQQAIDACKSMWAWYHLITNNEWMTIARNIEAQSINWSSWIVWSGSISNGVSNSTMWCLWQTNTIYPELTRNWATKTWPGSNESCNTKRQLKLSNWEIIWDLAWNVWSHVNGANTINWDNFNTMYWKWCSNATVIAWFSLSGNDWVEECSFTNWYSYANVWPKTPNLNANNWVWRILSRSDNLTDRVFLRGAAASYGSYAGIFALYLGWDATSTGRSVGFRCAF